VSDSTVLRLVVERQSPSLVPFPLQRGLVSATSPPFRVALDGDGDDDDTTDDEGDNAAGGCNCESSLAAGKSPGLLLCLLILGFARRRSAVPVH